MRELFLPKIISTLLQGKYTQLFSCAAAVEEHLLYCDLTILTSVTYFFPNGCVDCESMCSVVYMCACDVW